MPRDRLPPLLLALVVGIAAVLLAAARVEEPPAAAGEPHPEFAPMQRGGDGMRRAAPVLMYGWAFGALQVGFFAACFALGLRRRGSLGSLRTPLWAGLVGYQAVWALLVWLYAVFARDPSPVLWLSFPPPTAVMLFGLWPLPLVFMAIYLRAFDRWMPGEEELRRIRALADRRDEERGGG